MSVITDGMGEDFPPEPEPLPDPGPQAQVFRHPVKEALTPAPDGLVTQFLTSQPFKLGRIAVWHNGRRKIRRWDDGFLELVAREASGDGGVITGGAGGTDLVPDTGCGIQMKEAPLAGDSIQAQYEPA